MLRKTYRPMVARSIYREQDIKDFVPNLLKSHTPVSNLVPCSSNILPGICSRAASCNNDNIFVPWRLFDQSLQKRRFLGCGDGDEGSILSKVYQERRTLGYSPEQLFDVVAAVDLYHGFVPWCQRSDIVSHYPDGSFDAELEIGFKYLVESYISHVELNRPRFIKSTVSNSSLFDHLINVWEFNPGPVPGCTDLNFFVDFKFNSPIYRQIASMFFKEVISRLVGSFCDRCLLIYGPEVQIVENSYGEKV